MRIPPSLLSITVPVVLSVAGCSRGSATASLDATPQTDAASARDAAVLPDASGPHRHTIAIDGVDDFTAGERFVTTSGGYTARVTWDAEHVYVGYSGPDLDPAALDAATKWLFVYVDVDPGTPNGATTSETYNTQRAVFPAGFRGDFYARWKCDTTLVSLQQYAGTPVWTTHATVPPAARSADYVELAVPRAAIGATGTISLVSWMVNEKDQFEGTFAGLYAGNFADGYQAELPLTSYLVIDPAQTRPPADPANRAP
ncbi:MAG: hypothetical protein M3680_04385 [Myxococcota bacterium]|nr:hypothetical protein [Myxococcota bacterium]